MTKEELGNLEQENKKIQGRIDAANRIQKNIEFAKNNLNVFREFEEHPELIFNYGKETPVNYVSDCMIPLFEISFGSNDSNIENAVHDDFSDEKLKTIKFMANLLENRIARLEEEFAQL